MAPPETAPKIMKPQSNTEASEAVQTKEIPAVAPVANCWRCGSSRQTMSSGGNPQLYHCGSSERWQSPECESRCDIAEVVSEAWHLLNVLSLNMMDDGPTWPRVLEWLRRNEQYRPANADVDESADTATPKQNQTYAAEYVDEGNWGNFALCGRCGDRCGRDSGCPTCDGTAEVDGETCEDCLDGERWWCDHCGEIEGWLPKGQTAPVKSSANA